MQKITYDPPLSIHKKETLVSAPSADKNDGMRNAMLGPTVDGKLHGTTALTEKELEELAGMITRGYPVRVDASSLCNNGATAKLLDAVTWRRGTILFDPTPSEVLVKRSKISSYAVLIIAAGTLAAYLVSRKR